MKIVARLNHPAGPLFVGPDIPTTDTHNFTSIPLRDAHRFLNDIAIMYEGKALTLADKLVGATFLEDRTIYCAKRLEVDPLLDAVRSIPFVVEIIKNEMTLFLNVLPVAEVKNIGGKMYYGLSYGDVKIDYHFSER